MDGVGDVWPLDQWGWGGNDKQALEGLGAKGHGSHPGMSWERFDNVAQVLDSA